MGVPDERNSAYRIGKQSGGRNGSWSRSKYIGLITESVNSLAAGMGVGAGRNT